MQYDLRNIREDYNTEKLSDLVPDNPFELFNIWFSKLKKNNPKYNEIFLATADENKKPAVRIVLLKEFDENNFCWFTNYNSAKAQELSQNNQAEIMFYDNRLIRQIRIYGLVKKLSLEENKEYFYSRPCESQLSAYISKQSHVVVSREKMEADYQQKKIDFQNKTIPMPNWGGYSLKPNYYEFWQGRTSRLHDRIAYQKKDDIWTNYRLYP